MITIDLMVIFMVINLGLMVILLAINLDPTTSTSANLVTGVPNDLITVRERPYEEYAK